MDIVDSIISSGDAAVEAAAYIEEHKNGKSVTLPTGEEMELVNA